MKVLKFGGTSLGTPERMRAVARIIEREENCIVVCSAMAGVTDTLVNLGFLWKQKNHYEKARQLNELFYRFESTCYELACNECDLGFYQGLIRSDFAEIEKVLSGSWSAVGEKWLLAQGEFITTKIFSQYLNSAGISSRWLNAFLFMHKNAIGEPDVEKIACNISQLDEYTGAGRYLTQGYICLDHKANPDNLARGGSDYTATLIGAAVGARVIEIWTDIDGLHNNDPRFVEGTRPVRELSFGEAAELAYFGAKILHPACVWPASIRNIPVWLKNTMQPHAEGTIIRNSTPATGIRALAAKDGITIIKIRSARMLNAYGFLRRIFEIFENFKTPIDVITTSEVAVSVTIDNDEFLQEICDALSQLGEVTSQTGQSIICVVGDILARHQGYAVSIMEALKHFQVNMVSFGGSRNNLTLVVEASQKVQALVSLQKVLFDELQPAYHQSLN